MITSTRARKLRLRARVPFESLKRLNPIKTLKGLSFPLRNFECKVAVYQSSENFVLKTAESPFELKQALRLRHDIFYKELQNREIDGQLDVDDLDSICDHLIIIDKRNHRIVGTYRLISSTFSNRFYSQGEFDLSGLLRLPGTKLELGRACIHPDYRNGAIINLLWKGIVEYVKKTNTQYVFGCASVQTVDPIEASGILSYLQSKQLTSAELSVAPTEKYRSELTAVAVNEKIEKNIPALIHSYILAGAKFYGAPAFDRDFQCYDFFMMLKIDEMSRLFRRRYRLDEIN